MFISLRRQINIFIFLKSDILQVERFQTIVSLARSGRHIPLNSPHSQTVQSSNVMKKKIAIATIDRDCLAC